MAVRVVVKETGESLLGKFAAIEGDRVGVFSGIMSDMKHTRLCDTFWRRDAKGTPNYGEGTNGQG